MAVNRSFKSFYSFFHLYFEKKKTPTYPRKKKHLPALEKEPQGLGRQHEFFLFWKVPQLILTNQISQITPGGEEIQEIQKPW